MRRRRQEELRQEGRAGGLKEQIAILEDKLLDRLKALEEEEKKRKESDFLKQQYMDRRR